MSKTIENNNFLKVIKVEHNDKSYAVIVVEFNGVTLQAEIPFVIDWNKLDSIKICGWYFKANSYIATSKVVYLHNIITGANIHPGKGAKSTVDHINRIGLDNRLENLCIKSQTEQNLNRKMVSKNSTAVNSKLKIACQTDDDTDKITASDIPPNIYFVGQSGLHGCHFSIEIRRNNKMVFRKKTTKSAKFSVKQKLEQAKNILNTAIKENDQWFNNVSICGCLTDNGEELYKSYFEILKLANVTDPINIYKNNIKEDLKLMNVSSKYVEIGSKNLPPPETCITFLPKYVLYVTANGNRSAGFIYDSRKCVSNGKTVSSRRKFPNLKPTEAITKNYDILIKKLTDQGLLEK